MADKTIQKKANSREPLRNYTSSKWSATLQPDFDFQELLNMLDSEPVASGAIQHYVDKCMEGDWAIVKRDDYSYDKKFEDVLRYDKDFEESVLRKLFYIGKLFKNVFVEMVKDPNGGVKSYNTLDSTNVQPITKPNGDPISYKSLIPNPNTGEYAEWSANEVIWFKFSDRDGGFAHVDIMSLWNTLLMKNYIQRFVTWLWQTGQYRVVHNFKASNSQVVEDFIAYNKKNEGDYRQPFLVEGEYISSILRDMKETESLVELLKYLDSQILILLRVPPIDAGIPDASGRSNADAQSNNILTHVNSMKKVVSNGINRMFKTANNGNKLFVFLPSDRFSEEQVFKNVQIMKSMGMTDDACKEYMADKGVVWEAKQLFVDPLENAKAMAEMGASAQGQPSNPRSQDQNPSRQGKSPGAANKKQGTGSQSSTRPDQLIKKATKYWTYDVITEDED